MSSPEQPGPLAGTVMRGVSLAGAGWIVGQAMNFAFYLVLARLATPTDFGLLAAGTVLVGAAELFAESGMLAALVQRRDRVEEAANTTLVATFASGVLLSLLALAMAPVVGIVFDSGEIAAIAAAASVWVLLRAVTIVPDALMQRRFSFLRRVVVEPLGILVFGVTAVVAVSEGLGVWGLVICNTAQRLTMAIAAWLLVRWRPRPRRASLEMWRELIGFGRHVLAADVIRRLNIIVRTTLLGRFVGTAPLGQYTYAARLAQKPLGFVVYGASYVLYPAFSRISVDPERLRDAFLRSIRWIAAIAIPAGYVMIPLGVPFAVLLFGEPWRDAGYAAMAMFAYVGARSILSVCDEAFKAAGRPDVLPRLHIFSGVIGIVAIVALLPFGLVGVAAAASVGSLAISGYAIRSIAPIVGTPVRRILEEVWPPAVAATLMAGAVTALEFLVVDSADREVAVGLALLAGELVVAAGIYLGSLAAIAPETLRELLDTGRRAIAKLARPERAERGAPAPEPVVSEDQGW